MFWLFSSMDEVGRNTEDGLLDLNKEPAEIKRKRRRNDDRLIDNGKVATDDLNKYVGRVLRSRTMAMADGEKKHIDLGVEEIEDDDDDDDDDEVEFYESRTSKRKGGRYGRSPSAEGKGGDFSLSLRKKGNVVVENEKIDDCDEKTGGDGKKSRRGRARLMKVEMENAEMSGESEDDKGSFLSKVDTGMDDCLKSVSGNIQKQQLVDSDGLENGTLRQGERMGSSKKEKQLVRDQIISMLIKAEWTIEHRQRQSKDYLDAVYVDREGRAYWSVTLAYKKLKEKVDEGTAHAKEISAFNVIPSEAFSSLFRVTVKGKKMGRETKCAESKTNRISQKKLSKKKSSEGRISSLCHRRKQTLLARRPGDGSNDKSYELYEGKRSLLSWMLDLRTIHLGEQVAYRFGGNNKALLKGRITKDGICCDCCEKVHTIREFTSHAGNKCENPYSSICVENGDTLLQCIKNSWEEHVKTDRIRFLHVDVSIDDPNDDRCNLCGDGGDLICCDHCPSTFHHGCLDIDVPTGDWYCVYCSCKFCDLSCETESTANAKDEEEDSFGSELFSCLLCEEKFHVHCTQGNIAKNFDYADDPSFCSAECLKIYEHLLVLGIRHEVEDGFSYTILQHRDTTLNEDCTVEEINSKLVVAFSVMDECFEPIIDERSGSNVIRGVVYNCGSNIRRLHFGGFYTIILEKGDEIVAVASIRFHGFQLAEMPFIGTRYMYRRQGICKRLLSVIEKVLCSLGVEKLVIPAISELNETWTQIFGFAPLKESTRQEIKFMSLMVFPGIDMLEKAVENHQFIEMPMSSTAIGSVADELDHSVHIESIEAETSCQTPQEPNNDSRNLHSSDFDGSKLEIDSPDHEVVAVDSDHIGSLNEAGDVETMPISIDDSTNHENCLDDLSPSNGSQSFVKESNSADCKLEAKQSADDFVLGNYEMQLTPL